MIETYKQRKIKQMTSVVSGIILILITLIIIVIMVTGDETVFSTL